MRVRHLTLCPEAATVISPCSCYIHLFSDLGGLVDSTCIASSYCALKSKSVSAVYTATSTTFSPFFEPPGLADLVIVLRTPRNIAM